MLEQNRKELLEVSALTVAYSGGHRAAVSGVGLSVASGEALGLVGESGAGKSTVALAILGLLPRDASPEGSIRFAGVEVLKHLENLRSIRWQRISLVPQEAMNAFNPVTTIGEQIAELWVTHERASWRHSLARAGGLLERVGLSARLVGAYPHELSGGMRQRAWIAMAMALSPELVIVDEPTSALDVVTANAMVATLNVLRQETGTAFLVISHDFSIVARTCERVAVMRDGRIVEIGPVDRVLSQPESPYTNQLIKAVPRLLVPDRERSQ